MKASELIKMIEDECGDSDPEVKFMAYRWSDDLEEKNYFDAYLHAFEIKKGLITVFIDT